MNTIHFNYFLILCIFHCGVAGAQKKENIDPYSTTSGDPTEHSLREIAIDSSKRNILSPQFAKLSAGLRPNVANHMLLWFASGGPKTDSIEWKLKVPADGKYSIKGLLALKSGVVTIKVNNDQPLVLQLHEPKWNRVDLGEVSLVAGENRLIVKVETPHAFKISALEITVTKVGAKLVAEAMEMRKTPDWFKDAGYGLMFQWTNRATPPAGSIKDWEKKVDDFDLDALIEVIDHSGASFVVWSATWGQQYISAPIQSLDRILAGRTTRRDLLGEMATRLHEKGIRLIFYYHYGYDCYHSKDPDWMRASGGYLPDKTKLFGNVRSILTELGERYGEKLDGWFFDGGQRFYNAHFDGTAPTGILSAPFREISIAARTGNKERIICYNSWVLPRLTEYQDYFAGEGQITHDKLDQGVFQHGPQKGIMAFGCFPLERRWGHIDENRPIGAPRHSVEALVKKVRHAKTNRYPIAINLEMYENGAVSPDSAALLKSVQQQLEAKMEVSEGK